MEGWTDQSAKMVKENRFDVVLEKFLDRNVVWRKWHGTIVRNERELTVEEIYEDEKNAGIDYLKALSEDQ